ncbi:MAG: hypothetical protein HZA50_13675 [Planctomycetes bacterium]|nr:hypothetical protein [Planctomycetota bacterium]
MSSRLAGRATRGEDFLGYRPDRLLCELNKAVFREVSRILGLDKNK